MSRNKSLWGLQELEIPLFSAIVVADEASTKHVKDWLVFISALAHETSHGEVYVSLLVPIGPSAQDVQSILSNAEEDAFPNLLVDVSPELHANSQADSIALHKHTFDRTGVCLARNQALERVLNISPQSKLVLFGRARCAPPPTRIMLGMMRRVFQGFTDLLCLPMMGLNSQSPNEAVVAHASWKYGGRSGSDNFSLEHIQSSTTLRSLEWEDALVFEDASASYLHCAVGSIKTLAVRCNETDSISVSSLGDVYDPDAAFVMTAFTEGCKISTVKNMLAKANFLG
jgi:hypothetical protein